MQYLICLLVMVVISLLYSQRISLKNFRTREASYLEKIKIQQIELRQCSHEISTLKKQLLDLKREVEFYKNIEEDSGNLNVQIDHTEYLYPLHQDKQQIEVANNQKFSGSKDRNKSSKALLDEEQSIICDKIDFSFDNFFITGKAGTGKSFLLEAFRNSTNKKHIVLAPTGIAALNVHGATLHSTFGFYNLVKLDIGAISAETIQLKSEKQLILKEVSTIIIDEVSMISADTFERIDLILKAINQNTLPFGGKQIILFGDLFQLPPIAKPQERNYMLDHYGGIYFFHSNAYKNGEFHFFELTINHRQKDDDVFFSILNRIRDGSTTPADIEVLNTRVVQDTSIYDRFTMLLPTKAEVETINQKHLDQLDSRGFTFPAKITLNKYPNQNLNIESIFPIATSLLLKKGALVMMVSNDPDQRWVNGTLGIVSNLSNNSISVAINKQIYDVYPCDFTERQVHYENGRIIYEDILTVTQYPIVPAYAITIHKSQGQTYNNVICDIDRCFANGQAYVALSRCSSLKGLNLKKKITGSSILVDKNVLDFYQCQTSAGMNSTFEDLLPTEE